MVEIFIYYKWLTQLLGFFKPILVIILNILNYSHNIMYAAKQIHRQS